ncbi:hypothetical protein [Xylanimonas ulmi]|uniref:Uncharacterized protein n=1 Tax=Xylanimonas ulmi TaxID=228973 RepID=A0A4Q7MAD9_9MICO|nr:hypothetical protein [Xylanibacterium ulmi]RZS63199.1 hypothetical protein EV386_3561 [Xylanibacterium ulmi]
METQQIVDRARLWADYYAQVQAQRSLVRLDAERALDALKARLTPVRLGAETAWQVLALGAADADRLRAISAAVTLAPVSAQDADAVRQLERDVPEALADIDAVAGAKRMLARPSAREAADDAVEFLTEYVAWGEAEGLVATLKGMEPEPAPTVAVADALAPHVGLSAIWRKLGAAELVAAPAAGATPPSTDADAPAGVAAVRAAITQHAATHLAVFSTAPHTAAELLTTLAA